MEFEARHQKGEICFKDNVVARKLSRSTSILSVVLLFAFSLLAAAEAQLQLNFYQTSCPTAETVAKSTLQGLAITDPTSFAALLRLVFHDCIVQGCDASIMLDSNGQITSERVADKNFGIRRLNFIDRIKANLEGVCPGVVSCADIIAIAARDAISLSGGPTIPILTGRRDSLTASNTAADAALPPATVSIDTLLNIFGSQGLSTQEAVAILGAHTLGVGHCVNIVNRLYPTVDPTLPTAFAATLRLRCPFAKPVTNVSIVNNDLTNLVFDNGYFRGLLAGMGVFTVDSELSSDSRTRGYVTQFAQNQQLFFQVFSQAFVKLTQINVLTGANGQIRKNCHAVNS